MKLCLFSTALIWLFFLEVSQLPAYAADSLSTVAIWLHFVEVSDLQAATADYYSCVLTLPLSAHRFVLTIKKSFYLTEIAFLPVSLLMFWPDL